MAPHVAALALLAVAAPLESLRPTLLQACGLLVPGLTTAEFARRAAWGPRLLLHRVLPGSPQQLRTPLEVHSVDWMLECTVAQMCCDAPPGRLPVGGCGIFTCHSVLSRAKRSIVCCRVSGVALPALLGAAVSRAFPPPQHPAPAAHWAAAMQGAQLEVLCRSLGCSEPPSAAAATPAPTGAGGGAAAYDWRNAGQQQQQKQQQSPTPDGARPQQQEAFDAALVHLSAYCHTLTGGGSSAAAGTDGDGPIGSLVPDTAGGGSAGGTAEDTGGAVQERLAPLLAQRAFGELAAAVTAAERRGLLCGRAQTLLLHLLKASRPGPSWPTNDLSLCKGGFACVCIRVFCRPGLSFPWLPALAGHMPTATGAGRRRHCRRQPPWGISDGRGDQLRGPAGLAVAADRRGLPHA